MTDIISNDPNQPNPSQLVNHYQQVRKTDFFKYLNKEFEIYFQDDLTALGKLIVALSCRSLQSAHRDQIQMSIDLISRNYSSDLKNLITYLLSTNKLKSIVEGKKIDITKSCKCLNNFNF
jgi:PAB-dependent poly(A)-specific ribonuclease subunit 3